MRVHCGGEARAWELSASYTSPTLMLEAIALLLLFSKISVGSRTIQKLIEFLAPSTFIVYIVHSNPVFRRMVDWYACFRWMADLGECCAVSLTLIFALVIFVAISTADAVRRKISLRFTHCIRRA